MGATLIGSVFIILSLFALQVRVRQLKTNYQTAISHIDQSTLTPDQQQELNSIQSELAVKEKLVGKVITLAYIVQSLTAIETIVVVVYLTRPKVKSVFRELEKEPLPNL